MSKTYNQTAIFLEIHLITTFNKSIYASGIEKQTQIIWEALAWANHVRPELESRDPSWSLRHPGKEKYKQGGKKAGKTNFLLDNTGLRFLRIYKN